MHGYGDYYYNIKKLPFAGTEFENLLDEIRAARDTKDISNIVRGVS